MSKPHDWVTVTFGVHEEGVTRVTYMQCARCRVVFVHSMGDRAIEGACEAVPQGPGNTSGDGAERAARVYLVSGDDAERAARVYLDAEPHYEPFSDWDLGQSVKRLATLLRTRDAIAALAMKEAAEKRAEELVALVKKLEWQDIQTEWGPAAAVCPVCDAMVARVGKHLGRHKDGCALAAAIAPQPVTEGQGKRKR